MKKNVIMYIHSTITSYNEAGAQADTESMEQTLPATYYEKGDAHYIFYKETDSETGQITSCRLEISGKKMLITRQGNTSSQMELDVGRTTSSHYQTPFGALLLEVSTDTMQLNLAKDCLKLQASYSLSTNGTLMSKHTLQVILNEQ